MTDDPHAEQRRELVEFTVSVFRQINPAGWDDPANIRNIRMLANNEALKRYPKSRALREVVYGGLRFRWNPQTKRLEVYAWSTGSWIDPELVYYSEPLRQLANELEAHPDEDE